MEEQSQKELGILHRISTAIVNYLEAMFYRRGYDIATRPGRYVTLCLLVTVLCSFGFFRFRQEQQPVNLWLPRNSNFVRDFNWLMENYGEFYRIQSVIITADDVLQPHVLMQLEEIHGRVKGISADGAQWSDICFRIPALTLSSPRRRRDLNHLYDSLPPKYKSDPSVALGDSIYCAFIEALERKCLERTLLDLWSYNRSAIQSLTKEGILEKLNKTRVSPVFGHPMDYVPLLGGVERNASGVIVSAKSLLTFWVVHVNFSNVDYEKSGNLAGTGDLGDAKSLEWEIEFSKLLSSFAANVTAIDVYYTSGRSFADISNNAMFQDIGKLLLGGFIMFIYIQLQLSKCNWVELRVYLGMAGMVSIVLALIVSYGFCSMLGIFFGPVHHSLPFLLLGIGVDDMFIIMQNFFNLSPAEKIKPLPEKIGLMMQHAGASITVTSLTDFVAFAIGSATILPCLQSFCLYAAVGILATYFFQSTFFVACLTWDERRIEQKRNGVAFCIKHEDFEPNIYHRKQISKTIFGSLYSNYVLTTPGKVFVLLLTAGITAISLWGNLHLRQEFDQMWFIPKNTHLANFSRIKTHFYPEDGQEAAVYMGKLNYSIEFRRIQKLVAEFRKQDDILHDVKAWSEEFQKYVSDNHHINLQRQILSDAEFSRFISKFLFSPSGAIFEKDFRFDGKLTCGQPAPPVVLSSFEFKFRIFSGPEEHIPALRRVRNLTEQAHFRTGDKFVTVWGKIFANWVTDEVIDAEMYRNLALAMFCVMISTFILIANVRTCLLVLLCVVLTLIDVGGMMFFWDMTIDIVSCVGLVLAVGLCVDYAAHIGLTFMTYVGSKDHRALRTIRETGPAVWNGGISTLLALSVLADSDAHVFIAFFKIFLLVVVFGLFNGIVLLPVLLSLIGPKPYHTAGEDGTERRPKIYQPREPVKFIKPKVVVQPPDVALELLDKSTSTNDAAAN
ncbi:Hypothetical predicted protein [Cloeon dipterum]|uniref:SSD domain-containing protein n=1 Tax=Cloeon dipterum TaxID=197152 RepID=A0A8S1CLJ9_9INSE|nr:Hypothetical predicted protein [Cloeon dipterum]